MPQPDSSSTNQALASPSPRDLAPRDITPQEFRLFRDLILRETGISLRDSKSALVSGRLAKRLRHHSLATFLDYYDLLSRDPAGHELQTFVNCVTTNKTSFFRESHHFDTLRRLVIRPAVERALHGAPRRLRLWSAACSTGQEAYSLAISVLEELGPSASSWDLLILATDIDTDVLNRAEAGIYDEDDAAPLSPDLQRRYFLRSRQSDGLLRVRDELRSITRFRRLNFMAPAWPLRHTFDAIFCRNVLIYFDPPTQDAVLSRMVPLLSPDGLLFVGHSELLYRLNSILEPLQGTVYRRRATRESA